MYGLVNKAVEDLVCSKFGQDAWDEIKQKAGVDEELFISMDAYPDDITYNLVGAASEVLGLTPAQVLEAFGEYWVVHTAQEGYGDLLKLGGDSLPTFLQNLNTLHSHVSVVFPHLKPPSFECTDVSDTSLRLHYHSSRAGLAPMVIGLVKGLGTMFATEVTISQTCSREEGAPHDEFLVRY